jgi:EpsI family protein
LKRDWATGKVPILKLDADVVKMLNPDQIVFRRYRNPSGRSVELYGVFYGSQGADRTMHSPLNCYPGSGWEIVGKGKVRLRRGNGDGNGFEARKLVLRKGLAKRLLYYWYYAGGKTASDQYMNKALTLYGALVNGRTDGGLVTVSTMQDDAGLNQEYMEKEFLPVLIELPVQAAHQSLKNGVCEKSEKSFSIRVVDKIFDIC